MIKTCFVAGNLKALPFALTDSYQSWFHGIMHQASNQMDYKLNETEDKQKVEEFTYTFFTKSVAKSVLVTWTPKPSAMPWDPQPRPRCTSF